MTIHVIDVSYVPGLDTTSVYLSQQAGGWKAVVVVGHEHTLDDTCAQSPDPVVAFTTALALLCQQEGRVSG